jgi:flagellar biosynthesis/type III secretory pathway protein FliH
MGVTAGTASEHRYQLCRDRHCDRFPCRVYKEGRRDGYDDGHREGYDEGYAQGFPDGIAACPGPHGGRG